MAQSSDDSMFGQESESDEESDEEISFGRDQWLKKPEAAPTSAKVRKTSKVAKPVSSGDLAIAEDEAFTVVGRGGKAIEFSSENLFKNLGQILEARGKKVNLAYNMHRIYVVWIETIRNALTNV